MSTEPVPTDQAPPDRLTTFEQARPRLFSISYRILGSVADAEDVVQETWLAWSTAGDDVRNPDAYLNKAAANRALNRLRDIGRRREGYVGPWLPEPLDTARRPDESAELADSLSFALLVLLDELSPAERVALVLREVFEVPTAEVADVLDRSPEAVRQLVSRARSRLRGREPAAPDRAAQAELGYRFVAAIRTGDLSTAVSLLAPDVVLSTDGGGKVSAALRPVVGADNVLRFLASIMAKAVGQRTELTMRELNGAPALVTRIGDEVTTAHLAVANGVIETIWMVRNPDKLRDLT